MIQIHLDVRQWTSQIDPPKLNVFLSKSHANAIIEAERENT
ncbi:conserved hypothetical protein [delta proteobacterium NaphS2]|nr:conserved hypothetical protein [delta proteobacterium NaphS2]